MLGAFVSHRPNQPRTAISGKGKYGKEIGLLKVNVEFPINCRASGLNIGDIEEMAISAPRKPGTHCLAYDRMHAVAPSDVVCFA